MKKYAILMVLISFLISCNDGEKRSNVDQKNLSENEESKTKSSEGTERDDNAIDFEENRQIEESGTKIEGNSTSISSPKNTNLALEGKFIKVGENGTGESCDCSCFQISYSSNTELCVAPNNIYISAKFRKTGSNSADVFLVEPVKVQNLDREIPWDKFDRNIPIAKLKMSPNGEVEMDWIGFSVGGELAVDYAIYGKKALEGTYKRE